MKLLLILIVSLFTLSASAATYSVHAGFGPLFGFPDTVRVGYDDWQVGKLNTSSYGVVHNFRSDWSFVSFGAAVVLAGSTAFGPCASMGFNWNIFGPFTVRGELFAVGATSGVVTGSGLLGLVFKW